MDISWLLVEMQFKKNDSFFFTHVQTQLQE